MARPRKEIDKESFEKLCALMCTLSEIASFFNVSDDTIERWCVRTYGKSFADVYKKYCGKGKIALRRYQMQLAEKYPAMAIFLGKQYLGQRDAAFNLQEDSEGRKIEFVFKDTSAKNTEHKDDDNS